MYLGSGGRKSANLVPKVARVTDCCDTLLLPALEQDRVFWTIDWTYRACSATLYRPRRASLSMLWAAGDKDLLPAARRILRRVHRKGVIHGDLRARTFIVMPLSEGGKPFLIDFSHTKLTCDNAA